MIRRQGTCSLEGLDGGQLSQHRLWKVVVHCFTPWEVSRSQRHRMIGSGPEGFCAKYLSQNIMKTQGNEGDTCKVFTPFFFQYLFAW